MTQAAKRQASWAAAPESDRQEIRQLVAVLGERPTVGLLQVSRQTLGRLLGGLPVSRGTLAVLRERLPAARSASQTAVEP
jgi:hypothetical protein